MADLLFILWTFLSMVGARQTHTYTPDPMIDPHVLIIAIRWIHSYPSQRAEQNSRRIIIHRLFGRPCCGNQRSLFSSSLNHIIIAINRQTVLFCISHDNDCSRVSEDPQPIIITDCSSFFILNLHVICTENAKSRLIVTFAQ